MHAYDLHVIQGPNITRDALEKIAFFAFLAFVVEDSRFQQNRVRAKLYNCGACVCKSNVEIRIAGSFFRPQLAVIYTLSSLKVKTKILFAPFLKAVVENQNKKHFLS